MRQHEHAPRARANRPFLRDGGGRCGATAVVSVFDGVRQSVDLAAALTNATFGRDAYAPFSYPGPTASELPPELIGAFLKGLGPILRMHYPTQAYALHPCQCARDGDGHVRPTRERSAKAGR